MQNLEKQVGQIFKMLKKIENYQIRDKCQLIDLAKVVDFITQKFNLEKKNGQARTVLQEKLYFNSWI